MTIIDKKKRSPFFVRKPNPEHFKSTYEEQKYWANEKRKWIEGDGEIPPALYFYMSQGYVKHRVVPQGHDPVEPPIPRMASLWMHQVFRETQKKKKVQIVFKGRNVGLSTEAGAICNYYAKVHAGSNCIVTSKDQDGISVFFEEKIYVPYQHFDPRIKPDELAKNSTKQKCFLKLGVSHIGNDNNEKYSISTINLRETSETPRSPQNFSGQGAAFGIFDELPLHPRKEQLLNSAIECFRNPFTKELDGFLLAGGTCEESMSADDIKGFKDLIDKKDAWDCEVLFIPFWWSFRLDEAGYPDEKGAHEWWEKEAEKLSADPKKLKAFIRNNPRTVDDVFETAGGNRWEEDVEEIIKLQEKKVRQSEVSCPKHHLINLNNKIEFKIDNKGGNTYILEHPLPACTYILGVDGIATDEQSAGGEGSNMSGTIIKMLDPNGDQYMPVAIYYERPKTIELGYERLVTLCMYYNMYGGFDKIWAEANAGTSAHFGNYLIQRDLRKWISMRRDLSGKGWVDSSKMFQYRTDELKDFQYRQANMFLRRYAHVIQMPPLLEQMMLPKSENADILDSWLQFFVAKPDFGKPEKVKSAGRKREILTIEVIGGKTMWKKV